MYMIHLESGNSMHLLSQALSDLNLVFWSVMTNSMIHFDLDPHEFPFRASTKARDIERHTTPPPRSISFRTTNILPRRRKL